MDLNELIEQKKKEFSPTIKRLETIKVIEYILSKCIESQKEIIADCIYRHFDQVCEEYETVMQNVLSNKTYNRQTRIEERSIYLYNVLMTIIGKEKGRRG